MKRQGWHSVLAICKALSVVWEGFRAVVLGVKEIVEALLIIAVFVALVLHALHALGYPVPDLLSDILHYTQWPD